jgi:hypothetical protein
LSFEETFIRAAHRHCTANRKAIKASASCGCFYCRESFSASRVDDFIEDEDTALCPVCGIDSVLPDASGLPVTEPPFLTAMHAYWFERTVSLPAASRQIGWANFKSKFARLTQRLPFKKNSNALH